MRIATRVLAAILLASVLVAMLTYPTTRSTPVESQGVLAYPARRTIRSLPKPVPFTPEVLARVTSRSRGVSPLAVPDSPVTIPVVPVSSIEPAKRLDPLPQQPPTAAFATAVHNSRRNCPSVTPLEGTGAAAYPLYNDPAFKAALEQTASTNCDVVLTFGNSGYVPMMANLLVSLGRVGAPNTLVVALSEGVCDHPLIASSAGACVQYPRSFQGTSKFGSAGFASLVHVKTEAALCALALGYSILLADADMVMLRNPLPDLAAGAASFDVQIQDDAEGGRNSGFMYLPARPAAAAFLVQALTIGRSKRDMRQQPAVNQALSLMSSQLHVKVRLLLWGCLPTRTPLNCLAKRMRV